MGRLAAVCVCLLVCALKYAPNRESLSSEQR